MYKSCFITFCDFLRLSGSLKTRVTLRLPSRDNLDDYDLLFLTNEFKRDKLEKLEPLKALNLTFLTPHSPF